MLTFLIFFITINTSKHELFCKPQEKIGELNNDDNFID